MRQGYQLFATDPEEGDVASYAEAETPGHAAERCYKQFPIIDGYTNHKIKNIETRAEYNCKKKEPDFSLVHGMVYTLNQIHKQIERKYPDQLIKLEINSSGNWSITLRKGDYMPHFVGFGDTIPELIEFCLKEEENAGTTPMVGVPAC